MFCNNPWCYSISWQYDSVLLRWTVILNRCPAVETGQQYDPLFSDPERQQLTIVETNQAGLVTIKHLAGFNFPRCPLLRFISRIQLSPLLPHLWLKQKRIHLSEIRGNDSRLRRLFLTAFVWKAPRGDDPGPQRHAKSVGVNLRCCLTCLSDSSETHFLDVCARREK